MWSSGYRLCNFAELVVTLRSAVQTHAILLFNYFNSIQHFPLLGKKLNKSIQFTEHVGRLRGVMVSVTGQLQPVRCGTWFKSRSRKHSVKNSNLKIPTPPGVVPESG